MKQIRIGRRTIAIHTVKDLPTFREYCLETISKKEKAKLLKPTTVEAYLGQTALAFPAIGDLRLNQITAQELNDLYGGLINSGYSPKTVREVHNLISGTLQRAWKEDLLPINIALKADPPKRKKPTIRYYTPEQIKEIFRALEEEPLKWRVFVQLLFFAGLRKGEAVALWWEDVNPYTGAITIHRNGQYTPRNGVYIDTPKTAASNKVVLVPHFVCELIEEHRQDQIREGINSPFMFARENGEMVHPDAVKCFFERMNRRNPQLPKLNCHAFRHSVATYLHHEGVPLVQIAKMLGHSSPSTTLAIYTHAWQEGDEQIRSVLEKNFILKGETN